MAIARKSGIFMDKKRRKEYTCSVCGRPTKHRDNICSKHFNQKKVYNCFLDENPRREYDPNEIVIVDNHAEIILYDGILLEETGETVLIDLEDMHKVKGYAWKKKQGCIVANDKGKTILLANLITETRENINHINGNALDYRRDNLEIIENKRKQPKNPYRIAKKNKNKVIIEFVGDSHNGVVGSSILCSYPTKSGEYEKILIEFGMVQKNGALKEEYNINKKLIDGLLSIGELKGVFVSHSHLDHTGLLPCLVDNTDKFIMTLENKEISQPLLLDGAYILSRNSKALESKKGTHPPFYTEQDVFRMLGKTEVYSKNEMHTLNEYVSFRFLPNNHIVGATSIELFFKMPSGVIKKVYYSGDMGSPTNQQPFCDETVVAKNASVVITEATYSDLDRCYSPKEFKKEREQMKQGIIDELKQGKSILIPAFAQSRTQNILYYLYETFSDDPTFNTPIYLDGKLSLEINSVYRSILKGEDRKKFEEILGWELLHFVSSFEDSMTLATRRDEKKIVLSSAGMMNIGRILNHLKANIENPMYTIMIVGYCSPNTIGGQILLDTTKVVKIEGMEFKKVAKVIKYKTWSSHIQGNDIIKMCKGIKTDLIIIHHSDDSKYKFANTMIDKLRESNKSTRVICADKDNSIFFI